MLLKGQFSCFRFQTPKENIYIYILLFYFVLLLFILIYLSDHADDHLFHRCMFFTSFSLSICSICAHMMFKQMSIHYVLTAAGALLREGPGGAISKKFDTPTPCQEFYPIQPHSF